MLVLSRRTKEQICIPDLGITIEVIRVQGNRVKLGIDAPKHIPIRREEIAAHPEAAELQFEVGCA